MSSPRTKDHVILVSAQVLGLDFGTLDFSLGLDIHNYNIVVKSEKLEKLDTYQTHVTFL